MKITKTQLRKIIREQIETVGSSQPVQLTRRQMKYIAEYGISPDSKYSSDEDGPNYIGVIYDQNRDLESEYPGTPFDTSYFTIQVTPEIVDEVYQATSVFKKGPATIPSGWFWMECHDLNDIHDVAGPYPTREAARAACLAAIPDIITPDAIQDTPNSMYDGEAGF